jgi:hypothetical protein
LQCHSATVCNDFRSSQSSSSCFSSHHFSGGYWTRSSPEVKSGSSFVFTRSAHHIRNLVALTLHARAAAYTDSSIAYGIRMRSPTREPRGLTGPRWLCRHQSLQKPAGPSIASKACWPSPAGAPVSRHYKGLSAALQDGSGFLPRPRSSYRRCPPWRRPTLLRIFPQRTRTPVPADCLETPSPPRRYEGRQRLTPSREGALHDAMVV